MPVISRQIRLNMKGNTEMENMTSVVQDAVSSSGIQAGTITIFVKHTTASVMIIEDEPGIRADTKHIWERLVPADRSWQHNTQNPGEDNGHSHLRGQMQGASLTVPFVNGALTLGTWQQIVLIDFDTRARTREIILQLIGE
jgi:secondary thiamine-phosphate synthase enzyme